MAVSKVYLPLCIGSELDPLKVYGELVPVVTEYTTSLEEDLDVVKRVMRNYTKGDFLAITGSGVYDAVCFAIASKMTDGHVTILTLARRNEPGSKQALQAIEINDLFGIRWN